MGLGQYNAKRDFHKTSEPSGISRRRKAKGAPIFVVQKHHASRLHYDFRLEADEVLKSWAVPKGPSMDPADKRLAGRVEDHPLAYATFEGTIPEGEYGAGKVEIWDHGTYDNVMARKPEPLDIAGSIEAGHLEIELRGKKLQGKFALIRMGGPKKDGKENWLIFKMKEQAAPVAPAESPQPRSRKNPGLLQLERVRPHASDLDDPSHPPQLAVSARPASGESSSAGGYVRCGLSASGRGGRHCLVHAE